MKRTVKFLAYLWIFMPTLWYASLMPDEEQRDKMPLYLAVIINLIPLSIIIGLAYLLLNY